MNRELYFGTVFVVTCDTGCPEEGAPFETEERFYAESREEAQEWIDRQCSILNYHIEEWAVLTDGRRFVPVAAREFDTLEGVRDWRVQKVRAGRRSSK